MAVQRSTFTDYEHLVVADHCPKAREVYEIFKDDNEWMANYPFAASFFEEFTTFVERSGGFTIS